jgi:hypothetical protein
MNFQLDVDLFMHYTWVAGKPLLLNWQFLSQLWWSNGQSGWLTQVKGFRLWVRTSVGTKRFQKCIFRKNVWKTLKSEHKNQMKLQSVQKGHYFDTHSTCICLTPPLHKRTLLANLSPLLKKYVICARTLN